MVAVRTDLVHEQQGELTSAFCVLVQPESLMVWPAQRVQDPYANRTSCILTSVVMTKDIA